MEEKEIMLTDQEIETLQNFCEQVLLKDPNAVQATSILQKITSAQTLPDQNVEDLINHPRLSGRRPRVFQSQHEVPLNPTGTDSEKTSPILSSEPQPDPISGSNTVQKQNQAIPANVTAITNQKLNFFQHLLQKFRPAARM